MMTNSSPYPRSRTGNLWRGVEEYKQLENDVFLKWKKQLNKLQNKHPNLPPFEKNLDFWRQLWKIVEISDVVVQVVDARDPLFYASHDLSLYVDEAGEEKVSVLLLNKADYLTQEQRKIWADYFKDSDMKTFFFSATEVKEVVDEEMVTEFNQPDIVEPPQVLMALKSLVDRENVTVGFLGILTSAKAPPSTGSCSTNASRCPPPLERPSTTKLTSSKVAESPLLTAQVW